MTKPNQTARKKIVADLEPEDFRVRVAREKRGRMRARLLEATLAVYAPNDRGRAAVIDDVIRAAEVSRGTFYKYFETLEEAVAELGQRLAEEALANYRDLFITSVAPATRVAGGPVMTLARTAMEPRWGLFTASVDHVEQASRQDSLYPIVAATLLDGRQAGVLRFNSIDAAADMMVGATVAAIKRLAHGEQRNRDYILELTALCLSGLGMTAGNATKAAHSAWALLCEQGTAFPWWQEI